MAILATESGNALGTTALTGKVTDNVNGGTESFVWQIFSGGASSLGDGAGMMNYGPTSMSIVRDPRIRKIRAYFDPLTGTSGMMLTAFARNDANNLGARRIALYWASNQTSFRLSEITTVGGALTNRATKTTTAPGAPVWLELDATTGTTIHARVYATDGVTLLHDINYNFLNLPSGDGWGFGGFQNGNTGKYDNIYFEDGPTTTPPVLGTPVATSTGSSSCSATVVTDTATGTIYALFSTGTPDDSTIISTGVAFPVTASGTRNITLSTLQQAATGKVHVVHTLPTLERSLVARSNTITLNDPLPAPDTTVATTINSAGDIVVSGTATNTSSVSVSVPAAPTPNGAVTRPSQSTVPAGGGVWSVVFSDPPYGTYAAATIILSNADNPVVNKSGEQGVDIIPIEGFDIPEDIGRPILSNPVRLGTDPATLDVNVQTSTVEGIAYIVYTASATKPTAFQIKLGQDHLGDTPLNADSVTVTSGSIDFEWEVSPSTHPGGTYYAHIVQESSGGISDVVSTPAMVIGSLPVEPAPDWTSGAGVGISAGNWYFNTRRRLSA